MKKHSIKSVVRMSLIWCVLLWSVEPQQSYGQNLRSDSGPASIEFFESRIRPVLVEYCYECHNSQRREGGLALDSRPHWKAGGDRQRTDASRNWILEAIRHDHEDLKMPEGGAKLSARVIADFEAWFAAGAADPRDHPPAAESLAPDALRKQIFAERDKWWSLQPLRTRDSLLTATTQGNDYPQDWSEQDIDRLVYQAMRSHELTPSEPADAETLVRRLYVTLIGLVPSAQELEAGALLIRAGKTDALIDQLLASQHYGERWARHWMDWIRYADSHGSEGDPAIPYAYQYRDYLIRAINSDVPYDRLVQEHIAGDCITPRWNDQLQINEAAIGPAHLRMVFHGFAPTDAAEEKVRFIDDQIAAVSKSFLGLTVACARCHDHKFDAVRQADYYALFGILGSCRPGIVDAHAPQVQDFGKPELQKIKLQLKEKISSYWLEHSSEFGARLLTADPSLMQAIEKLPKGSKELWKALLAEGQSLDLQRPLPDRFIELCKMGTSKLSTKHSQPQPHFTKQEKLPAQWIASAVPADGLLQGTAVGNGSCGIWNEAGEFCVAESGQRAINMIFPAGRFSNALSTRHRNVWLSPRIELDDQYELWVLVAGEGDASVRYAVQDYPRNGTVYPVTPLTSSEWRWQRYDLSYWKGDSIHLELATAGDAPVLARNTERSWFGLRDAKIIKLGSQPSPAPIESEDWEIARRLVREGNLATVEQALRAWQSELKDAVIAWRANKADDAQVLWLNAWLQLGLLPEPLVQSDAPASGEDQDKADQIRKLVQRYRSIESQIHLPFRVPGVLETVGQDAQLFERGDHKHPREAVPRGYLKTFDDDINLGKGKGKGTAASSESPSGRTQLAERMTTNSRPLMARVIVNRIWHHLFGRGIVATTDNFGKLGAEPTHPELLEYLASDFIQQNCSMKALIRKIVRTRTWQQSSRASERAKETDPENLWLSHGPMRRMEAEVIRDAQLQLAGKLDRQLFGPAVDGNVPRRSIYIRVQRNALDPQLRVFDFPEPASCVGRRDVTNVPAQALQLLNNSRIRSFARSWAERVIADRSDAQSSSDRIASMLRDIYSREPEREEVTRVSAVVDKLYQHLGQIQSDKNALNAKIQSVQKRLDQIVEPARRKQAASNGLSEEKVQAPEPILQWEFDDLKDRQQSLGAMLVGKAELHDGVLETTGGHFQSAPLPFPLHAKTLEAVVQVEDLKQRGGGVISIQSKNGSVFDSIVLGEQAQGEWLAGSDHFHRTKPFQGAAETVRNDWIHLAITYDIKGNITGYRNGERYGSSYRIEASPVRFEANETVITCGCRHLPGGGNKQLKARWDSVRIYDRALKPEEVLASYRTRPHTLSNAELLATLDEESQKSARDAMRELDELRGESASMPQSADTIELQVWTEVALALMASKESIFVP